jgi:hypothetical protein
MASMLPSHLVPCRGCSRNIRAREDACPFCRATLPDAVRASTPPRRIVARLSRAGLIAAGATAAVVAAVDCASYGGSPTPYGLDLPDASDASATMTDASDGGPPLDSGSDADDGN